jgi:hypothetical protein
MYNMEDFSRLSNEQLADKMKDLIDNLNASRVIRDATITTPGGPPSANAIAEYTQQESVITPLIRQCMRLLLDPYRIRPNIVDDVTRGGRRKSRRNKRNKRNTRKLRGGA